MKARLTKLDRVPIKAVPHSLVNFEQCNIDLIGPIDPKSARNHSYIVSLIDNCSRWVEMVPLKTLKAQELCDALLSIFVRVGIPRYLISDNATNMVSNLNTELYKRLGIELRTSSPLHPEGNSLVERWNQTLKRMLHHLVLSDKPRDWDKRLDYLLWSYRELPNATTGLSPFQLVFGRGLRGPLSVLKDSWTTEKSDLPTLNLAAEEYLEKLQTELRNVVKLADENCQVAQKVYVDQYNRHAKDKCFDIGDLVLVLLPDSTNKLKSKWMGPATVTAVLSPYSYRIALGDGSVRTLHANRLRKYNLRIQTVGVIFEDDSDFGNIEYCPIVDELYKSNSDILNLDLSYLSDIQSEQLRALLLQYVDVFNDKPGHCNIISHAIHVVEGFQPKMQRAYRIPEKLRGCR